MEKYKLKKEARQFFDEKYHRNVSVLKTWKDMGIPIQLLEEVPVVFIDYGHEHKKNNEVTRTDLCGWSSEGKKAEFKFTIRVNDIESSEYDKVNVSLLMDEMQKVMDKFFKNHINH